MSNFKALMNIKDQNKIESLNSADKTSQKKHEMPINQIDPNIKRTQAAKAVTKEETMPTAKAPKATSQTSSEDDESLKQLTTLWNCLGVTEAFRTLFELVSSQIPPFFKSSFFSKEIAKLTKIKVSIQKLNRDILSRDKIIALLKKYNTYLSLECETNQHSQKKVSEKIINELKMTLRDLRIISLNIVRQYRRIRKEIGYDCFCGKYDVQKIANFNMEYMQQMKTDTLFLASSSLANLFRFSSEEDVFLSALRREIPYEEAVGQLISKCQIALINEVLMNQLYQETRDAAMVMNDDRNEDDELFLKRVEKKMESQVHKEDEENKTDNTPKIKLKREPIQHSDSAISHEDNRAKEPTQSTPLKEKEQKQSKENKPSIIKKVDLAKQYEEALMKEIEEGTAIKTPSNDLKPKPIDKTPSITKKKSNDLILKQLDNKSHGNSNSKPVIFIQNSLYSYEYLTGNLSSIQTTYSSYYEKIDKELLIGFNIHNSISSYIQGSFPQIIQIKGKENVIQGLAVISYDSNTINGNKLNISSISSIAKDSFCDVLLSFIDFCKAQYSFDELNIELYYGHKDDKFYLIKSLEDIIKAKAKFKWVNIINDGNVRKIKYKLTNAIQDVNHHIPLPKIEAFQLKSGSLLFLKEHQEKGEKAMRKYNPNESKILKFPITSLLCEMLYNNEYSIDHPLVNYMNLEVMKEISQPIIYNLIKTTPKELGNVIRESIPELNHLFSQVKLNSEKQPFLCSSLFNVNLSFNTLSLTCIGDKPYIRIAVDSINAFTLANSNESNSQEDLLYLLKTKNEHISLVIYEHKHSSSNFNQFFSKEITRKREENEKLLGDYFNEIYPDLIPKPSLVKKNIYLPPFRIEETNSYKSSQVFDDLVIQCKEGKRFRIESLTQIRVISLETDESNKEQILFDINEDKEDIVVRDDFFVAVVHYGILNEFEIANVAAFVVDNINKH